MNKLLRTVFHGHTTFFTRFILAAVLLAVSFAVLPPVTRCRANAGPPPSILIIVPYAPDDLEISIAGHDVTAQKTNRAFETYFTFYLNDMKSTEYTLRVTSEVNSFDTEFGILPKKYNNTWVLDLEGGLFTSGIPLSRSVMLVSIRVVLTLILEGLVFLGFGFRKKRSWLIFLLVNLVTQGLLNVWINYTANPLDSYIIFSLIFMEFWIFIIEMILFSLLIKEQRLLMTNMTVLLANLISLLAGGFLITVLPV